MSNCVGQQLGHYRLTRFIGHGGFADVYLGEHIYLGTLAAVKVLSTRLSQDEIDHFKHEAYLIAQLEHPHIVRVLDFGTEGHLPFLVMSYAPNGTLRQRHPKGTQLALRTVVSYAKQIADALQYAHSKRLIHRDIKPENLLIGPHDEVLLSDFGLAVMAQSSSWGGTRDVSGTIVYMAPEQARGKPHPNSDQYALAVVVYEWLCGKRPFNGTYEEVVVQHAFSQPASLYEYIPALSPTINDVIMKALEKDPHNRYASVQDFAEALEKTYLMEQQTMELPTTSSMSQLPTALLPTLTPLRRESEQTPSETVFAIAWSPDNRRIAHGGHDKTVQIRGATTGANMLVYHGHTGTITTIAWSPDGQYIASSSLDHTIQVWNSHTGQHIATYANHGGMVSALAWSPDGQYIASTSSGTDHTIHIWYASTGNEHYIYRGHAYWVRTLSWSPNGSSIASCSWREVQVWDTITGQKHLTYRGHRNWVRSVCWSPHGTRIATAGEDNTVQVWEPFNKGHLSLQYHGHVDWISTVRWSPDGHWIASASKDHALHIWDVESAHHVSQYLVRATSIYAIAWLADSKHLVSASSNGGVQVWQVTGDR